ncbi:1770_t:CDS:2, partial [Paraglomus occultum]
VSDSMKLLADVEEKKAQKTEKEKELKNSTEGGGPSQQQKLRVCEVCSAYLSIYDSDRRLADHFGGKMHIGYLRIRELLRELREKNKDRNAGSGARGYDDRDRDRDRFDRDRHLIVVPMTAVLALAHQINVDMDVEGLDLRRLHQIDLDDINHLGVVNVT